MSEFRARIRSVRPKTGGQLIMFPTAVNADGDNLRGKMIEHAKIISGNSGELDGFLVIGLWADGRRSLGYRMPARIPREMLPAYIAEILRTDCVTDWQAGFTFDEKFEWVE